MSETADFLDPLRLSDTGTGDEGGRSLWSPDLRNIPYAGQDVYKAVGKDTSYLVEDMADAIDVCERYIDMTEGRRIILKTDDGGDTEVIALPYTTRFTHEYRLRKYAQLKGAEREVRRKYGEDIPAVFVTLTLDPKDEFGNPRPWSEALNDLKEGRTKLLKLLRKMYDEKGVEWSYMWVIEPQQNSYPHLHMMILGTDDYYPVQQLVNDFWVDEYGIGEIQSQDVEKVGRGIDELENPAAYLMKYIGKGLVNKEGKMPEDEHYRAFMAGMWISGARQFGTSQDLSGEAIEDDEDGEPEREWVILEPRIHKMPKGIRLGHYKGALAEHILWNWKRGLPPPMLANEDHMAQLIQVTLANAEGEFSIYGVSGDPSEVIARVLDGEGSFNPNR